MTAPSAPTGVDNAVVEAAKRMVEQADENADRLTDEALDAVEVLRDALIAHDDQPEVAGSAANDLLYRQLCAQLAEQAIEYIDAEDGSEECIGVYAEMVSTRLAIAKLEAGAPCAECETTGTNCRAHRQEVEDCAVGSAAPEPPWALIDAIRGLTLQILPALDCIPDGRIQKGCHIHDGAKVRANLKKAYQDLRKLADSLGGTTSIVAAVDRAEARRG